MRKFLRVSILFVLFVLIAGSFVYWQNRERVQNELYRTYYGQYGVPAENIDIYEQAGDRYEIDWKLLAAIHRVETIFSNSSAMQSSVGAIGPFQFMPKTWVGWGYEGGTSLGDIEHDGIDLTDPEAIEKYGGLGVDADQDGKADPTNLTDSAHTAAKYLNQHDVTKTSERQTLESALFEYNRSEQYVVDVLAQYDNYQQQVETIDANDLDFKQKTLALLLRVSSRLLN
ncbi:MULTISPECIES: lytic transglycosylase domain-containing protein [Exiguobacterium]|uniref:Lysozyme n=1 Tax=Exiguobacterium oxidotolerans TaxID=223958 RepID=A0A653IHL9_9BACL|nr:MULTISPECIES: lytic transglycosylase domain-containing protein [Exiguobacterium]ASI35177.1 lysozyme [Exiguobacterium sp. N4-1P]ASI37190.1 lysozyme [Exiguobacterium sp. N4-1P]VWX38801.1 Lysozyme [Exiguobacterium oxidotolerans]